MLVVLKWNTILAHQSVRRLALLFEIGPNAWLRFRMPSNRVTPVELET